MKMRKNKSSPLSSTLTSIAYSSLSNLNSCSLTNLESMNSPIAPLSKSISTTTPLWVSSFFILYLNITWEFVCSSHIFYFLQFLSCFLSSFIFLYFSQYHLLIVLEFSNIWYTCSYDLIGQDFEFITRGSF